MPEENNTQQSEATTESNNNTFTAESIAAIVDQRVNEGINKFVASNKTDLAKLKQQVSTIAESFTKPAATEPTKDTPDQKYSVLERQVKDLQEQNKAALEKAAKADRDAALGKVLSTYTFANETSRDIAWKVFAGEMNSIGDGQYAIGDQPFDAAIKTRMESLTGLLAPKNVGGSGASSGNNSGQFNSSFEIKPGMTREQLQAIANEALKSF
jgi:hypothetical protein